MRDNKYNRKRVSGGRFLAGVAILAVVLGGLFLRKYLDRKPLPAQPPAVSAPEPAVKSATLFFASPDGTGLVRESRLLEACNGVEECAEEVLVEIINGPIGDLTRTLPETTMYHSVSLTGDILTIDFGRELTDGMASGSDVEMAAVYSIVDSLAVNFPQIKSVKLLVDGKQMDTLKGHIDLREPLTPDFTIEKAVQPPATESAPQRSNK